MPDLDQCELNLRLRRTPERVENDVRELVQLLRGRDAMTAREIEEMRPGWATPDHRYVRDLASRSDAIVSGPGVRGYQLAADIPLARLCLVAAARQAQIRAEGRELIRIRRIIALRAKAQELSE